MNKRKKSRSKSRLPKTYIIVLIGLLISSVLIAGLLQLDKDTNNIQTTRLNTGSRNMNSASSQTKITSDSIKNRELFNSGTYFRYVNQLRASGQTEQADTVALAAEQPMTIWLTGPSQDDRSGSRNFDTVRRTSTAAKKSKTVPVYQLYAIPDRDSCGGYSGGGHQNSAAYLTWVDGIINNLKGPAVFLVEADALAHTVTGECLSYSQKDQRYNLLSQTVEKLSRSESVIGVYIDAAHPEWFPDSTALIEPLKKAGVEKATGIAVNVSNFVSTEMAVTWSEKLLEDLGGNKTAVIDSSRNGNGSVAQGVEAEERWCNPTGRAAGRLPTTNTGHKHVDAYLWVKIIGESDGECRGNPPAGTFSPQLAIELINNSRYSSN